MKMLKLNKTGWLCLIVLMIGGLNLGLMGFFDYNFVSAIFIDRPMLARTIYGLVGIATLYTIFEGLRTCKIRFTERRKAHPA